jgi:two-component system NtrC family sensor kinase
MIIWNGLKYGGNVQKDCGELPPPVSYLPLQLNQVFMNLLNNASHAIEIRPSRSAGVDF